MMDYDIAIIGGGPAGYNAAERAAANGLRTVLFEQQAIGGVCLNQGCIPSKALLYAAKLADSALGAAKYGVHMGDAPSFDLPQIIKRKDKVVKKLTLGVKSKLTTSGVAIVEGQAGIQSQQGNTITITCNGTLYQVGYLLLCTGSEVVLPPIKGLAEVPYWTSREALNNTAIPASLAIIGGGAIGMEFASLYTSLGTKVSVIEMMPEILGAMDKEVSGMLRADYAKKGVKFYLNTKVTEITPQGVVIDTQGQPQTLEAERVLVCVGRKAVLNTPGIDLLHLALTKHGVQVDQHMQTSNPRVYACGDVTGVSMLAHTAIREGDVAINHLMGIADSMSYRAIPAVVYTNPEVAGVGHTEATMLAEGRHYRVARLPMAYAGRFVAENEAGNGMCKLIIDQSERIVGCHMLGNPASELIVVAGIAIEQGYTVEQFSRVVFPHPTVGEIMHECLSV